MDDFVLTPKRVGMDDFVHFDFYGFSCTRNADACSRSLDYLGALDDDDDGNLTELGEMMSEYPSDPQMSTMSIPSPEFNCSNEILTICYGHHPLGRLQMQQGALLAASMGDHLHLTRLNVYHAYEQSDEDPSWCEQHYINPSVMKFADNVRQQVLCVMTRFSLKLCSTDFNSRFYFVLYVKFSDIISVGRRLIFDSDFIRFIFYGIDWLRNRRIILIPFIFMSDLVEDGLLNKILLRELRLMESQSGFRKNVMDRDGNVVNIVSMLMVATQGIYMVHVMEAIKLEVLKLPRHGELCMDGARVHDVVPLSSWKDPMRCWSLTCHMRHGNWDTVRIESVQRWLEFKLSDDKLVYKLVKASVEKVYGGTLVPCIMCRELFVIGRCHGEHCVMRNMGNSQVKPEELNLARWAKRTYGGKTWFIVAKRGELIFVFLWWSKVDNV
ncbi:hypothetical protein ACLOJK_026604 [Asimina triloba]